MITFEPKEPIQLPLPLDLAPLHHGFIGYSWRFCEPDKVPSGATVVSDSPVLGKNLANWYRAANWKARGTNNLSLAEYIAERGPTPKRTVIVVEKYYGSLSKSPLIKKLARLPKKPRKSRKRR